MDAARPRRIAILTSGGDAQGMNAAVRAAARAAIRFGAEVFAVRDGYQGMVDGGEGIVPLGWHDVSGIQHRGGTVIGTARCVEFRERAGRKRAAYQLVSRGIDRLVVIGGDGSLTGANTLATEWSSLLDELVDDEMLEPEAAAAHPALLIAGLVGSIDNDMVGTDMTIGADSALHRIVEALDAISSTAASHHRAFVVEVMGRRCGYLALTAAIAGSCDFALIPEAPPTEDWPRELCDSLERARELGRRESIVVVAEGARDRSGAPITADRVCRELQQGLGADARVTILGHVQRGGAPSAFDRSMATMVGYDAASCLLSAAPEDGPRLVGVHRNRVRRVPLMRAVHENQAVSRMVDEGAFDRALAARGDSYAELFGLLRALSHPGRPREGARRIAVLHSGGLAPGMNPAVRALVRLGQDRGHVVLGVEGGFCGLREGRVRELSLADVEGWSALGGAELGTRREVLTDDHLYSLARAVETHEVHALVVVGGIDAYAAVHRIVAERGRYPSLAVPLACLPASIDNNLPGTELSVGADTALNAVVEAIDRIKQSAMAARRCFVVETMGRECGYLATLSALSTGAEQVYLPEERIGLEQLVTDVARMTARFRERQRLFLAVRAEGADPHFTTDAVARVFQAEAGDLFDVRQAVLGHLQQGGNPSPFDRVLATRLAGAAVDAVSASLAAGTAEAVAVGLEHGALTRTAVRSLDEVVDWEHRRPLRQWWLGLRSIVRELAEPPEHLSEHLSEHVPGPVAATGD